MTLQYLDIAIAVAVVMLAVSLLITILVQLVANILSLRGSNLRWAVTTLIAQVHPDLKDQAKNVAQKVLTHPLISDSTVSRFSQTWGLKWFIQRVSLANAVRLEELVGVMDVLGDPAAATTTLPGAMAAIAAAAKSKMGPQVQAVTMQAAELVNGLNAAAAGKPAGWATGTINVDQLLGKVPGAAETVFGKDIKSWFNSTMDRASQRFTLHMRFVTVALAIVVAFAIHLDSFQLFSDLSASPELRASLVAQSGSMERLAGDILANQKKADATTPAPAAASCPGEHMPTVYAQAIRELQKSKADPTDTGDPANKTADAALLSAVVAALPAGTTFADRKSGADWLQATLVSQQGGTTGQELGARLIPQYKSKVDCMLQTDTDKLLDRAAEVHSALGATRFRLIPDPYPVDPRLWRMREWFGILFSAGLLGLGAPFWFNALKSLTALRPILANKQEKESKSATA